MKKDGRCPRVIRLLFFLRFKSQLNRTVPDIVADLESSVIRAFENAGASVKNERRLLAASFDESSLGIWLDILILIEKVVKTMAAAAPELYGYSLVIGRDIPQEEAERICRVLSFGSEASHVFCDPRVQQALEYYARFEKKSLGPGIDGKVNAPLASFARLTAFRSFTEDRPDTFPLRETIFTVMRQAGHQNVLLLGPDFSGKRDGLYRYCESLSGDYPPLTLRFSGGGRGLSPLVDALSPRLRAFFVDRDIPADTLAELDQLYETMFRDRLRDEVPPAAERRGRRFFRLLLETYAAMVQLENQQPVVILEDVHQAAVMTARIFLDTLQAMSSQGKILVYGTAVEEFFSGPGGKREVKDWDRVFPRIFRLNAGGQNAVLTSSAGALDISPDLWELAYALELLGCYFPEEILVHLLEEGGKNPQAISRALEMLVSRGVIDSVETPRPRIRNFSALAERTLGERKEKVRLLVRSRLLDWVFQRKIAPCFVLLEILAGLGNWSDTTGAAKQDELILESINADLTNGTYGEIERAITGGYLENIVEPKRALTVDHIFRGAKALLHGTEGQIREAFRILSQGEPLYPVFRARVLANITSFHLGLRDAVSAQETIKEAILLSQDRPWAGLAQSYRLFSLVNLSNQRIGETLDYAAFAVENAEKSGNLEEQGISSYYASAAQALFGNLARAVHFIEEAEIKSLMAGQAEWADYARFFRGRLAFDLGRYREARELFEDIRRNPAGVSSPVKEGLLAAWAYRSQVYFQNPLSPKPEGGGIDGDLFEIEAAYFAGDYEWAVELAARLSSALPQEYFLFTEQPDWRSGFAQCELLLLHPVNFWDRRIAAYRALALCRISPAGGEEALRIMQRILRDERLAEMDPGDAFYFYAWYQVLEQSGATQSDMNTAVSMAFKRLQRRASRIDDAEIRKNFLSQPRWNGALSLAAKEYKLI
jgi:tetratricopeptide (TPR) repeat protein